MGEYYRELLALKRVVESDNDGNPAARWSSENRADHYAHAELYALFAQKVLPKPFFDPYIGPPGRPDSRDVSLIYRSGVFLGKQF